MDFKVNRKNYGSRSGSYHGGSKWDYSWSAHNDYNYHNASIAKEGSYCDVSLFPGEDTVAAGDTVHVVYVSYSSGDSFGNESGLNEYIWAFSDIDRAKRLCDAIIENAAITDDDNKFEPIEFDGVPISVSDWKGYFEEFDNAEIVSLNIV